MQRPTAQLLRLAHLADNAGKMSTNLLSSGKLTVREAAKAMRLGQTTLRRMILMGEIPVIRFGGKILILEADLEAFTKAHYGPLKVVETKPHGLPPLPAYIRESALLKKVG